ncbi:hypothetical protein ABMA28_005874 [Loxostege sticticalis]|uniref:Uncharacterized protein n=1 Tax=Loxostege sticticalis TaxID=481309 RepID=A0ABD0SN55_LOXSC
MSSKVSLVIFGYLMIFRGVLGNTGHCPNVKTPLSSVRKKRYLTFPDDSSASITIDLAKTFMTHVPSGWYMTMDLDVVFPLPDSQFTIEHLRRKLHHKQKRDLWERIEEAVGFRNVNGRACILRSICEAKMHLLPKGKSMVHDVLRAIFTIPAFEKEFEEEMRGAYDDVLDPDICDRLHECPWSLLHFILDMNKPRAVPRGR